MDQLKKLCGLGFGSVLMFACMAADPATHPATNPATAAAQAASLPAKNTDEILKDMEQMADAQIAALGGRYQPEWVNGTFFGGLARLSHLSKNEKYQQIELDVAKQNNWEIKTARSTGGPFHADNECITQMYVDLAVTLKQPDQLAPVKKTFDDWVAFCQAPAPAGGYPPGGKQQLWWWCDALYMAPAGITRLSVATGDDKYIKEMDKQYWIAADLLYDKQEHLFYRDAGYLNRKAPNGKPMFWARGNGWVVGGLANILTYMPEKFESRPKYVQLFKAMTEKLATLQQPDGLWRSELLDPEEFPQAETSGSAFYCYAIAWGVNNGMLDKTKYAPIADKAWDALVAHRRADGLLGWVQDVGAAPGRTQEAGTKPYAVGAFLLSGAEIIKMHAK